MYGASVDVLHDNPQLSADNHGAKVVDKLRTHLALGERVDLLRDGRDVVLRLLQVDDLECDALVCLTMVSATTNNLRLVNILQVY